VEEGTMPATTFALRPVGCLADDVGDQHGAESVI
jgi:hypothetical protein